MSLFLNSALSETVLSRVENPSTHGEGRFALTPNSILKIVCLTVHAQTI
jgi:hypothetical protein